MTGRGIFSVSQFAKLSGTTRDILLNYDRLGLLSPVSRGGNNYRYYASDQLPIAYMIRAELELGTPLAKIKRMMDRRTPAGVEAALQRQIARFDAKMRELAEARDVAETLRRSISSVAGVDEGAVSVMRLPEEAIVMGCLNDYGGGRDDYDALSDFYADIGEKYPDMNRSHPVWAMFSADRVRQGDWVFPTRYYFYYPGGADRRPAGQYAVGYARGGYGQTDGLYRRMVEYIGENGYEICGDAYEEYPLNEVCITDADNYLIRVLITVRAARRRRAE